MNRHSVEYKGRDIVVHLLWAELEYDVKYGIAKRVKMLNLDDEHKNNYLYTDKDKDWLLRTISTALGKVRGKLKCNAVDRSTISSDELLDYPLEYNLIFHFDDDVQWLGHPDNLMNSIHAYVSNFCLAEYFDMADATLGATLHAKAEECLNDAYKETTAVILVDTPKFIL